MSPHCSKKVQMHPFLFCATLVHLERKPNQRFHFFFVSSGQRQPFLQDVPSIAKVRQPGLTPGPIKKWHDVWIGYREWWRPYTILQLHSFIRFRLFFPMIPGELMICRSCYQIQDIPFCPQIMKVAVRDKCLISWSQPRTRPEVEDLFLHKNTWKTVDLQ